MENIFRSLSFTIVQHVYTLFPELYQIFLDLASARYFDEDTIKAMSQNLYIVMCVCMLFALGIRLINAIVNPAALDGVGEGGNKKKSAKTTFLNSIFAVLLIVLIPIGFNRMYEFQDDIVSKNLIQKIVLGIDTSESDQNPGQIIAAYTFYSFCQPRIDDEENHTSNTSIATFAQNGGDIYNKAINEDINYLKQMDAVINSKTNGEYDLEYNAILAPAVGIYIFYQLVLLCMDMALRLFKLGLLELITPIILCGFLFKGTELLGKWTKEVIKTYILVFLKIALVTFMVYGLTLLKPFLEKFTYHSPTGNSIFFTGLLRTFAIIGLLQLIKQIPELINSVFGTNIKSRGGIRGRLGEMAAVGELAQKGWDQVRKHPIQTSQRLVAAPLSAIGGGIAHNVAALKSAGQQIGRGNVRQGLMTALGGMATTGGAVIRGGRMGWQNRNLQGIGYQGRRYEDTHKNGSTFLGRLGDDIRDFTGIESRNAVFSRNAEKAGKARGALSSANQSAQQLATSQYSTAHYNGNEVMLQGQNAYQMRQSIENFRNSGPQRGDHPDQQSYEAAVQQHNTRLADLEREYNDHVNNVTTAILNNASSDTANLAQFVDNSLEGQEVASAVQNSIIEQIGVYGANKSMEGVDNLRNIGNGTLGTQMMDLIHGHGQILNNGMHEYIGVDDVIARFTQQYNARGEITDIGHAAADETSRKNRNTNYESILNNNHGNNGGGH